MAKRDDSEFLDEARRRREEAENADRENIDEGRDDAAFAASKQWPDDIAQQRRADKRPMLTFNRIPQFIRQVTGDVRRNPPAIKVSPVDDAADKDLAKVLSGMIRHIERTSDAAGAYEHAIDGAATVGQGHFRLRTEYADEESFDQDVAIEPIQDHFAVLWDPYAKHKTKRDAKYCFVYEKIPLDDFKKMFPKASATDFEREQGTSRLVSGNWFDGESVTVAEYWYVETTKKTIAKFDDGRELRLDTQEDDVADQARVDAKRVRTIETKRVYSCLINGVEILTEPTEWIGKRIPIFTVPGEEIVVEKRVIRRGLVRDLKDPNRYYNFMRSAAAEAAALQPKAPITAPIDAIKNFRDLYKKSLTSNVDVLPYNVVPNAPNGGRPERLQPPTPATGFIAEAQAAIEDMYGVTGIYPASLGARSNETSGKAILARERQGEIGTYLYVANLGRAIAECGRELVYILPKLYDTPRVRRVLGEDDSEGFVRLNHSVPGHPDFPDGMATLYKPPQGEARLLPPLDAGKYDVAVSSGPSFSTKREESRESMLEFVRVMPPVAQVAADLIVKNMDWPGADEIADRLKPPDPGTPPPPDPKMQLEVAKLGAEVQGAQADAQRETNRMMFEREKMQHEAAKWQHEMMMKHAELGAQGMQMGDGGIQPLNALDGLAQMVAQLGQAQAQMAAAQTQSSEMLAASLAQLGQAVAMIAVQSGTPKRVVRDGAGRVVGLEPVTVQ